MTYSDNISKKEAARIINLSESTIVRMVNAGKFPQPYQIGGRTFFSKKSDHLVVSMNGYLYWEILVC